MLLCLILLHVVGAWTTNDTMRKTESDREKNKQQSQLDRNAGSDLRREVKDRVQKEFPEYFALLQPRVPNPKEVAAPAPEAAKDAPKDAAPDAAKAPGGDAMKK